MPRTVKAEYLSALIGRYAHHVDIESITFDGGPDGSATRAHVTLVIPPNTWALTEPGERITESFVLLFGRWAEWRDDD